MKFCFAVLVMLASLACNYTQTSNSAINNTAQNRNGFPAEAAPPTKTPLGTTEAPARPQLSPLPPDAKAVQEAIDVVQAYYDAIDNRDYRRAYELWSGTGEASGQTFEQFREGFANTASVTVDTSGEPGDFEGAAGSQYVTIPVRVHAKTKDGKEQRFYGEYVLRRSMVDGATPEQRSWRIYSAKIEEM